jgi:hypothetical protein
LQVEKRPVSFLIWKLETGNCLFRFEVSASRFRIAQPVPLQFESRGAHTHEMVDRQTVRMPGALDRSSHRCGAVYPYEYHTERERTVPSRFILKYLSGYHSKWRGIEYWYDVYVVVGTSGPCTTQDDDDSSAVPVTGYDLPYHWYRSLMCRSTRWDFLALVMHWCANNNA